VDFDSSQDLIQLNSGDYLFSDPPEGFSEGTAIFLRTSGENELIAILEGVDLMIEENIDDLPIIFI
jgi:hypothetical protein